MIDPPNRCIQCGKDITGKVGQFCSEACTEAYCGTPEDRSEP